jgi:hypothetical protein
MICGGIQTGYSRECCASIPYDGERNLLLDEKWDPPGRHETSNVEKEQMTFQIR